MVPEKIKYTQIEWLWRVGSCIWSPYSFLSSSPPFSCLWKPPISSHYLWDFGFSCCLFFYFKDSSLRKIIQYLCFTIWIIWLSIISLTSVNNITNGKISLFMAELYNRICIDTSIYIHTHTHTHTHIYITNFYLSINYT